MILSVSRRTDVPNYFSEWFFQRLEEGFLYVRNPMNPKQISRISITPDVVDCVVFWTKNPEPMLSQLNKLVNYNYYFQFTLTCYESDIERNVLEKKNMISIFRKLSDQIGADRVIWRYDPILFNDKYTQSYHLKTFQQIADNLNGYTKKCVISFIDEYAKNRSALSKLHMHQLEMDALKDFASRLKEITEINGMEIASCAEQIDLMDVGIDHNACIDPHLIEQIVGYKINVKKDKNQRPECGCIESIDVGTYNTCRNGCIYCYANQSIKSVEENAKMYDMNSPLLCGHVREGDKITERIVALLRV